MFHKDIYKGTNWGIFMDSTIKGLGTLRMKNYDDNENYFSIILIIFHIVFQRPFKTGTKQTAKIISSNCVRVDDKLFTLKYFQQTNELPCIWYASRLGKLLKITDFKQLDNNSFAIKIDADGANYIIVDAVDVYLFHPDKKIEGYLKGSDFIAVKSI